MPTARALIEKFVAEERPEDFIFRGPFTYRVTDGYGGEVDIEADSAEEACQTYVADGDWDNNGTTNWCSVTAVPIGPRGPMWDASETHTIEIPAVEPDCTNDNGHEWVSPVEVVGGGRDNPGVFGHGGGVTIHEFCKYCGVTCLTDTWAQDRETGEQGLTSTTYGDPDPDAMAWIDAQAEED